MLPDIDADHRGAFRARDGLAHQRAVLVGRRDDLELAIVHHEPDPAGTETAHAARFELRLEVVEAAKLGRDRLTELPGGFAARVRAEDFPEKRVVRMPARIVAEHATNRLRHRSQVGDQLLDGLRGQLRGLLEGLVGLRDVRRMVLVMMDFHRLGVDGRLQRRVRIRERWKFVCHGR